MSPAEDNDSFIKDIFCCILNTLFKSKIWEKIDELVQERDRRNIFGSFSCKKGNETRGVGIDSLFFYLVTPPFSAKKGNLRYRFQVQSNTIVVLFSGIVCPLLLGKQNL